MNEKRSTIIITGANGNIGSAMAHHFAEEGFKLILLYHRSAHRIEKLLKNFGSSITALQSDITNLGELETIIEKIPLETEYLPKSLIHAAAMRSIDSATLIETSPELWEKIIETNIIGTYNILKTVIPLFIANQESETDDNWNRIVLLGSDVSRIGLPSGSAYAASKAAISNLARSLSYELAEHNILINTVSPGPVVIDESHFSEEYRQFRTRYYEEILARTPLKRIANPSDVVSMCRFLISPENKYITGEEFFLTGGKF